MNTGIFSRNTNDLCYHQLKHVRSTRPINYQMDMNKFENCNKAVYDKNSFFHPFDDAIVRMENELTGRTRPKSKCNNNNYLPFYDNSHNVSTYSKNVPVVLAPETMPIIHNTNPRYTK